MRDIKRKRGSLTIEAAIVLPIFMIVIISILSFVKLISAYQMVQQSISQSANIFSDHAYILNFTGIKDKHDDLMRELIEGKEAAEDNWKNIKSIEGVVEKTKDSLDKIKQDFSDTSECLREMGYSPFKEGTGKIEGSINNLKNTFEGVIDLSENIDEIFDKGGNLGMDFKLIKDNPKAFLVSIGSLVGYNLSEKGKGMGMGIMTKGIMKWLYLDDSQEDGLEKLGIIDGVQGLDFNHSRLFPTDERNGEWEDVDIIVQYKFDPKMPLPILKEIKITQRVTLRAWMDGDNK